jgi:proteic killer suppression protein
MLMSRFKLTSDKKYGIRIAYYMLRYLLMIRSFKDRKTQLFFEGKWVRDFQGFTEQATRRLTVLDSAELLQDLAGLKSNRLESLSGSRIGQYSIRINWQWRICFRWEADGPDDVEIVDYH